MIVDNLGQPKIQHECLFVKYMMQSFMIWIFDGRIEKVTILVLKCLSKMRKCYKTLRNVLLVTLGHLVWSVDLLHLHDSM